MNKEQPLIAVIGAGRMGIGIAQVFAYAGCPVELIDIKDRTGEEIEKVQSVAKKQINGNLQFLCTAGLLDLELKQNILDRIGFRSRAQAPDVLPAADVIFEAVPEVLETKKSAFEFICEYASHSAMITSTTSTFMVDTLAGFINLPERFMNTHWLNPAYLMPLVEVSPATQTSEDCLKNMFQLLEAVGKVPVKCAASPGFIVPRIQALAMNEAARLYEEGVASVEDIDKAVKYGFGLRFAVLGLLEFIDWGGGDILFYASNYLKESLKADRFSPPEIVITNMENGNTGMKAGKGFYDFSNRDAEGYQYEVLKHFLTLLRHMGMLPVPDSFKKGRN